MASNSMDPEEVAQISGKFTCVRCRSSENKLRFLCCLHSCCERCLSQEVGKVRCRECGYKTDISGGMERLPPNRLHEIYRLRAKLVEPQICFNCKTFDKNNIGTHVCFPCDQGHLCDHCLKAHKVLPATRSHNPIALKDLFSAANRESNKAFDMSRATPNCPLHHSPQMPQPMIFYCETCAVPACQTCLPISHRDDTHVLMDIKSYARKLSARLDLEKAALITNQTVDAHILEIEGKIAAKEIEREQVCNEVFDQVEALKKMVDDIGKDYLNKVNGVYEEQKNSERTQIAELKKTLHRVENAASVTTMFQQMCSDDDMACHGMFFSECLTRGLGLRRKVNRRVVMRKPLVAATVDNLTPMLGQLEFQHFSSTVADVVSDLMIGKQVEIELVKNFKMQHLVDINGVDMTEDGDILCAGDVKKEQTPYIEIYTTEGSERNFIKHTLRNIWQIYLDGEEIYAGNSDRRCVSVMDRKGEILCRFESMEDNLGTDVGVVVQDKTVYLVSYTNHNLYRGDKGSPYCSRWTPTCKLHGPHYICKLPNGYMAISNHHSSMVCLVDCDKKEQWMYGSEGSGDGNLHRPYGVCADTANRVYIADHQNHRIVVVSPDGKFLCNILTEKDGIKYPRTVRCWNDRLVVGHNQNWLAIYKLS